MYIQKATTYVNNVLSLDSSGSICRCSHKLIIREMNTLSQLVCLADANKKMGDRCLFLFKACLVTLVFKLKFNLESKV